MEIYTIQYNCTLENGKKGSFGVHFSSLQKAIDRLKDSFFLATGERERITKEVEGHCISFLNHRAYKIIADENGKDSYPTHIFKDYLD